MNRRGAIRRARLSLAALLLSPGLSCSLRGAPQERVSTLDQGVTNGSLAPDDPAVLGLMAEGRIICTGVLVAPRVALTAAHCMRGAPVDRVLVGISAGEGSPVDVLRSWTHPSYKVGSADHDICVLLLGAPVDAPALPLNEEPLTGADVGQMLRVVGFGAVSAGDMSEPQKMQGTAIIGGVSPLTFSVEPSPSQPCSGDSGGPVLRSVNGEEAVVGIVSHGDADCAEYAHAVRVDAHLDDFVTPLMAQIEAISGAIGESCVLPGNCASDLCLSPLDAPSFSYCSRECDGPTACAPGMECAELTADGSTRRVCQFIGPSPGAIGAQCAEPVECEFGMCESFAGAAAKTCSALCFPEDAVPCPRGGVCTAVASGGAIFGCFLAPTEDAPPEGSSGCGIAGPSRAPDGGVYALLLACALALGRKLNRSLEERHAPGSRRGVTALSRSPRSSRSHLRPGNRTPGTRCRRASR